MTILEIYKTLRDAALAKHVAKLAAKQADDVQPVIVAKSNNVVPLPKRKGLLAAIASAGDYADAGKPEPPISQPLVYTSSLHTAQSISHEFDGDMRFDDAATRQWRQDQTKQWRDSNRDLKRPQDG